MLKLASSLYPKSNFSPFPSNTLFAHAFPTTVRQIVLTASRCYTRVLKKSLFSLRPSMGEGQLPIQYCLIIKIIRSGHIFYTTWFNKHFKMSSCELLRDMFADLLLWCCNVLNAARSVNEKFRELPKARTKRRHFRWALSWRYNNLQRSVLLRETLRHNDTHFEKSNN